MSDSEEWDGENEAELSGGDASDYEASPDEASESYESESDHSESEPGPSKKRKRDRPPKSTKKKAVVFDNPDISNIPSSEVKKIDGLPIPLSIWEKLKDHQKDGVRWLWKRVGHGQGAILGDEMGLGKTVQVIAILSGLFADKTLHNILIIVPATLQKQWVQEFQKWNTAIKVKIFNSGRIKPNHVYISSYEKVRSDASGLLDIDWNMVICDEGHRLRNPKCMTTRNIKRINSTKRIILTGSPIMNSLTELWSLVDFVQPGLLGKLEVFSVELAVPIQQGSLAGANQMQIVTGLKCAEELRAIVKPLLLRRLKSDINLVKVEKSDNALFIKMTEEQEAVYRSYLGTQRVKDALLEGAHCFGILAKLRQLVSHPYFVGDAETGKITDEQISGSIKNPTVSGKMQALLSLLGGWRKQKRKVLVFCQCLPSLKMIVGMCNRNNVPVLSISGQTAVATRQMLINEFNDSPEAFAMVLTSRVGGVGLNIHGATRTVIFEPDWNPGQDEQAAARIHRPQQKENVAIYRLITTDSIEEWIYQRQIYKHSVAQHVLSDKHNDQRLFDKASMACLLFGKGDTAETLKMIGADIKIDKKKKKSELEKAAEKVAEAQESSISKSLKKVYKKFPHLKPKKTDTIDGEKIEGLQSSSKIDVGEKKDYGKTEDWVLARLFKKAGCVMDTAVDQAAIKQGTDYKRIDEEAQKVAKAAVAALHKNLRQPKVKSIKTKGSSSSLLQKMRQRRTVEEEVEAPVALPDNVLKKSKLNPNYKLANNLRNYIEEFWRGPTSDDLIAKFDGNVKDKAVFKAVLKQMAVLDPKTRRWKLKPQYES